MSTFVIHSASRLFGRGDTSTGSNIVLEGAWGVGTPFGVRFLHALIECSTCSSLQCLIPAKRVDVDDPDNQEAFCITIRRPDNDP